jgi:hypothetical protein
LIKIYGQYIVALFLFQSCKCSFILEPKQVHEIPKQRPELPVRPEKRETPKAPPEERPTPEKPEVLPGKESSTPLKARLILETNSLK